MTPFIKIPSSKMLLFISPAAAPGCSTEERH